MIDERDYCPEQIYNCDETGLNYKMSRFDNRGSTVLAIDIAPIGNLFSLDRFPFTIPFFTKENSTTKMQSTLFITYH